MDAHALLSAQGWRGHGHSLHHNDDSIGLAKPLLLSRKYNTKGLGTTQHFNADQWWLNAFDEQLKGLETTKKGEVRQTVTTGKLNTVEPGALGKYSVYTSFVRGGFLEGTVDLLKKAAEAQSDSSSDSSDDEEEEEKETAPKSKSKNSKKDKKKDGKGKTSESKEERRVRKAEKRRRKEERALRRAARRERRELKASRRKGAGGSGAADEEKRRRRAKKEEKRRKRKMEEKKETKKSK